MKEVNRENSQKPRNSNLLFMIGLVFAGAISGGLIVYSIGLRNSQFPKQKADAYSAVSSFEEKVIPSEGVLLPIKWGDLGKRLVESGVIDRKKFADIYKSRGGLSKEMEKFLNNFGDNEIRMTSDNAGYLLNLFWAFGMANKNQILEQGPMSDPDYGGAGEFASTGGWTISSGNSMDHFSKHSFIALDSEKQALVERVSKNIYRPCCGNSTYFPDCNHGMAMLGLLELMAENGVSENEMYQVALKVNSYWFPDTYLTIAKYLQQKNIKWERVNPKDILGADFSSAKGYQKISSQVKEPASSGSSDGGCGVGDEPAAAKPAKQSGCGV
ncbi:hypothetical protein HY227_01390 [Candidatus Wolfebacteria bacterium]|nr:hypothetical protein [Candidatus Wolfebacteria bacterium]